MDRIIIYCLFVFMMSSCNEAGETFKMVGTLSDSRYNGEYIYLVPLYNATAETVDSVLVNDGKFSFEGRTDTAEVKILRTRPILRLVVQELLVVVEPGTIQVALDSVSVAGGTPLNEILQRWKDEKMTFDRKNYLFNSMKKEADEETKLNIERQQDAVNKEYSDRNFTFVKSNYGNVVGKFVFSLVRNSFTDEQNSEIELLSGNS